MERFCFRLHAYVIMALVEKLKTAPWRAFRDQRNDWGRDLAVYLGRRLGGLTLRELAEAAQGTSAGAMSVAVRRFRQWLATNRRPRALTERVESDLSNVQG